MGQDCSDVVPMTHTSQHPDCGILCQLRYDPTKPMKLSIQLCIHEYLF